MSKPKEKHLIVSESTHKTVKENAVKAGVKIDTYILSLLKGK